MKLNKLGTIFTIGGVILGGIGTLYAMDSLPVTQSAFAASQADQDKLFILSEIRTLNGEISNVKWDLQTKPQDQSLLRELDDLKLELELLRDKLNSLRN